MLKVVGRASVLCRKGIRTSAACRDAEAKLPTKSEKAPEELPARFRSISHELSVASELPIERRSLSRGLVLNKFEKDFMIYPEYNETEDLQYIKANIEKFRSELDDALAEPERGEGALSVKVLEALLENKAFSMLVSREFGGAGACQKDLMLLSEALGRDLSLFTVFNQYQAAATVISLFGSEEQKCKYLPRLTAFDCRPAICLHDEGSPRPPAEITAIAGDDSRLNGVKVDVMNADVADVFIVFAKQRRGDNMVNRCVIVDIADLGQTEKIVVGEKTRMQGLNGVHLSTVSFDNVRVRQENDLGGDIVSAEDIEKEIVHGVRLYNGAAVVGFLKQLIASLCEFASTRIESNMNARLSDTHPVQAAITDLSVGTFVLESMVYYIGGLIDEELYLLNDVENAIIQRYSNKILRQAITTLTDVAGLAAAKADFPYEKQIRDIVTLISLTESDLKLVRNIVLPTLSSYAQSRDSLPNLMDRYSLKKMIIGDLRVHENFKEPKLIHFIAEHVHPSLEVPAQNLELTMSRIYQVIDRLLTDKGVFIKEDYYALRELASVMENNLGMAAAIARTSRSYSIGLRNADLELAWTIYYCMTAAKQTENILQEVINFFGLMQMNPKIVALGKTILDQRGYHLEHPTEKNW